MTAGDDATQLHTDYGTINYGTVLTVTEIRAIALDVAKSVFLDSLPIAKDLINARTEEITDEVIRKIAEKDEKLYERFRDPRFLGPLASSQRSYAETGDPELGGILSGLLADLAGEPIRTRREIVLRESIECAPKLTTRHLNALTVIFRVTRVGHNLALGPKELVSLLDGELRPYFGEVPSDSFDYSYMGATQAGTYMPTLSSTVYSRIYTAHRNAMYDPIDVNELTQFYTESIDQLTADLNHIVHLIEVPYAISGSQKFKLRTDKVKRILSVDTKVINGLSGAETKFRDFLRNRSVDERQFTSILREESPELAQFLDHLQRTDALSFQLSPVGIMLARHEMESRSPETAAQVDVLFEDSDPLP
ncbi:LPO_1073/Vpar_1526 family protein [Mycobacterium sp. MS1601]|uniref:LPO_1073/Vpar_1526 family protein n=1 Tax=Mycobacterium sp. MS1601 TaxID=1936029 RepID=UPI0026AA2E22